MLYLYCYLASVKHDSLPRSGEIQLNENWTVWKTSNWCKYNIVYVLVKAVMVKRFVNSLKLKDPLFSDAYLAACILDKTHTCV